LNLCYIFVFFSCCGDVVLRQMALLKTFRLWKKKKQIPGAVLLFKVSFFHGDVWLAVFVRCSGKVRLISFRRHPAWYKSVIMVEAFFARLLQLTSFLHLKLQNCLVSCSVDNYGMRVFAGTYILLLTVIYFHRVRCRIKPLELITVFKLRKRILKFSFFNNYF